MRVQGFVAAAVVTFASSGCIAAPALLPAAFTAGGDLVKAGTVRLGGATFRTFSVALADLHQATRKTLDDLGFPKPDEEMVEERVIIRAQGVGRSVRIDLQPITGSMTQMRVFVRKETLGKDLATATELVAQTEQALGSQAEARAARRNGSARQSRR
jgi:hypothetical protein